MRQMKCIRQLKLIFIHINELRFQRMQEFATKQFYVRVFHYSMTNPSPEMPCVLESLLTLVNPT